MKKTLRTSTLALAATVALAPAPVAAQAYGGSAPARPVTGDPGIFSMMVTEEEPFRVLRDYAEPGATRRMHNHEWATYHVFVLVSGNLRVTIEGEPDVLMGPGEVMSIPGGARHTFTNVGTVTATIVEVFGLEGGGSG